MLKIVTGPFHPTLDRALLDDLRARKSGDPFAPLVLVVPSASLADRLKRFLAVESQFPLFNLHVLTFHQFALRLRDDLARNGQPIPAVQLADDFYFSQLLRQVLHRKLPGLEAMATLPPSPGTWRGLWATVRDLKDAVVDPATALKAVEEGLFDEDDRSWLQSLFTLQAAVIEGSRSLAVGSRDDLLAPLGHDLSRSSWLAGLRHVFFYGFYDLLQVQLSFFESLVRCMPVTFYFPLGAGPAYAFSRRFFERYLLPLADTHEDRSETSSAESPQGLVELTVTSVIGSAEELATVCREILTLVEVHGYRFDEIGVVVRSFDLYRSTVQTVFDRHHVPFTSTAGRPLIREPLVKALQRLASLPLQDFERSALLDVVTSPWYRTETGERRSLACRPDMWRLLVATLGIVKGADEWARLAAPAAPAILEGAAGSRDDGVGRPHADDPAQMALLSELVTGLIRDCERLPRRGSISRLTEAFRALARTHFAVPGWAESEQSDQEEDEESVLVGSLVMQALDRLSELDPVGTDLSWEEWTELFRLALEDQALPIEGDSHRGVLVLDAMEARGLRFRALFVLGLNDQLFPRVVREDAFLRDRQRLVLESTLGYLIEEKLAGHEEERLLFEILTRGAQTRLYLSYQRADEDGRVMAPSPFVALAQRDSRLIPTAERVIPRRLTERIAAQPVMQEVMPVQDLAVNFLLHEQEAGLLLDCAGQHRLLVEQGLAAQEIMERDSPDLGPFDGMVGMGGTASLPQERRALSPTSLERYAICPFQYFAEKRLRLESVRLGHEDDLPAHIQGTLLHDTLRVGYERLTALQWPDVELDPLALRKLIADSAAEVFAAHAAVSGTGHALLWTLAQEQVVDLVTLAVLSDQEDCRSTGYRPRMFEVAANGLAPLGEDVSDLAVRGTLDRVDVRADPPGLRIIDYKFKQGGDMKTEDRNLALGAARGFRLQPPLYAYMTLPSLPLPSEVQFLYLAPRWDSPVARATFERARLSGEAGQTILQTLRTLVQGIERQEFFILPDGYCDHCEFSAVCRRYDAAVWWRSYRSPQARSLRRLRKVKVNDA
ncbi:MAG: PD-(D/E)XK nuclease family protein [Nitrospira sp.]|nr:PD-(D/E)XK nuclease family protein [Nitrospira sp.]